MMKQDKASDAWGSQTKIATMTPGQRKRPHTASQQPLSLRDGNLAHESWWNPIRANQSVSKREI
jgi:hypothetical protein